jgi:hypothetical protein
MAADEKAAVAAEVIDDGILQNSTQKKPLELSLAERTTMPEDAILEPYSEVERARCRGKCAY